MKQDIRVTLPDGRTRVYPNAHFVVYEINQLQIRNESDRLIAVFREWIYVEQVDL